MASKIGDLFRSLFGSGSDEGDAGGGATLEYNGYVIRPTPRKEGGEWLTAGVISRQIGDETKEHHFIRAERHASRDSAADFSLLKAKQIIDEQGDRIFRD